MEAGPVVAVVREEVAVQGGVAVAQAVLRAAGLANAHAEGALALTRDETSWESCPSFRASKSVDRATLSSPISGF